MTRNVAVLMAAGHGTRFGGNIAKQFIRVRGKMLLEYALQTFQQHARVDEIAVVLPPDCPEEITKVLRDGYSKIRTFVAGGSERFLSSWAAVQLFENRPHDNLFLHDAARPLLSADIITALIRALSTHEGAVVAVPATDTVFKAGSRHTLAETLNRAELYYAQTPQAFRAGLLCDSFRCLFKCPDFVPTDESGLVAHFHPEVEIRIVEGAPENFKITCSTDMEYFKLILQNRVE